MSMMESCCHASGIICGHIGKCIFTKKRYVVIVMLFWCLFNLQLEKCVSQLATVAVTVKPNETVEESKSRLFSHPLKNTIVVTANWGLPVLQLASGFLANRYGGKFVLAFSGLMVAIMTLVTAQVVMYGNYAGLVVTRFICGLAEGMTFPVVLHMIAKWAPPSERTSLTTYAHSGIIAAMLFCNLIQGLLVHNIQCFSYVIGVYCFSAASWLITWSLFIFNDPIDHPYISEEERDHILEMQSKSMVSQRHGDVPFWAVLRSLPIWALILAQCGHEFSFYIMQFMFPKFVNDVIGYDLDKNGFVTSIPYLFMGITAVIIAKLTDLGIKNGIVSVTAARKIVNTISSLGSTAVIVIAPYVGPNKTVIMSCFSLCFVFKGLYYPSIKTNILDLAPNYAGVLAGITNGIGSTMGIIGPILTGYLISNNSGRVWSIVFWVTGILLSMTSLIYLIFGSGKLLWWNNEDHDLHESASNVDKIHRSQIINKSCADVCETTNIEAAEMVLRSNLLFDNKNIQNVNVCSV